MRTNVYIMLAVTVGATVAAPSFSAAETAGAGGAAQKQAADNFIKADADADGALTLAEFTTLIDLNADHDIGRSKKIKRFGRYDMAFGRIDADANGLVTNDELSAVAARAQQ